MKFGELLQSGDWKGEKHVPVIEAPEKVKAGEPFDVTLSVGKEIAHPNTTEHHICWIKLSFKPEGDKFGYEVAKVDFDGHGASVKGANEGPVFTDPYGVVRLNLKTSGTLIATSYCNIHGFWESSQDIVAE
ncbi:MULTISPECIES: class II SORL domain-containing protein [Dethiosulfovibrio]|jgi:superoxide reductase|uniref:Class II SORL domain-containing protein n=2 Tax=Dethiosulfovibrio TaxID=47054 RepID=A0ABS9ETL8_9BACT|nr:MULTISPECIES: class II SORL domain-containing protein [Dethiosulfovibrio]MCF4114456.1 class II SORL domain-containing protein [Dethiosulfovibrio russensis]MCF4143133.1 class II SORL domain-containing protein [Dethiosulfovibrio marinus]MCF4146018.1 class II SORL domain-containing protein [Dethiosulfovibrio acidaminovorans]